MNKKLTPDQDLERLFDDDAGEFGAIYRRLSRPEPPRRLDRIILADAACAVHGHHAPRAQRWALAMGSVAGVVLAAGIAWQVGRQMQAHDSVPEGSRSMQDSRVVPVEAISEPRPRKKARSDLIMRDGEIPLDAGEATAEPISRMTKEDKTSAARSAEVMAPPAPAAPPPAPRSEAVAPPTPLAPDSPGKSAPAQARPAPTDKSEAEAFGPDREAELEKSFSRAGRARPAVKNPPAGATQGMPAMESRGAAAEPQASAGAARSADQPSEKDAQLPAEAWLEDIERLASSGQRRKAIESLRQFRKEYPDWPLPESLRQLEQ